MFVAEKSKQGIINLDACNRIYVGFKDKDSTERTRIKVSFKNGETYGLGDYATEKAAMIALRILTKHMESNAHTIYMPTDKDVESRLSQSDAPHRRASTSNGKKLKRHGGS